MSNNQSLERTSTAPEDPIKHRESNSQNEQRSPDFEQRLQDVLDQPLPIRSGITISAIYSAMKKSSARKKVAAGVGSL